MAPPGPAAAAAIAAILFISCAQGDGDYLLNGERHDRIKRQGALATRVLGNGVEVLVAEKGGVAAARPARNTALPDRLRAAPEQPQKGDFVTKTYLTTYTYLTTFSEAGSTVVSSRERVVSNVATEEIHPTSATSIMATTDHVTLATSPHLTTGVYRTTYTYLNTLIDGEEPLVVTSRRTVANTVTEQPPEIEPSEAPSYLTNTYTSTVAYTKTVNEGDGVKVVRTEDVLTRIVITESDFLPSAVVSTPTPTLQPGPFTTDVTKTYFVTYTYFRTLLEDDSTVIKSEVATSSDIVTEKYTVRPKKTQVLSSTDMTMKLGSDDFRPTNVVATKTYLTTFTYFTTLLQDNTSPSIVVKSRTKVVQNVVTETIDPGHINTEYMSLIHKYKGSGQIDINNVQPIKITSTEASTTVKPSVAADLTSSFDESQTSNIVTGSTVLFVKEDPEETETKTLNSSTVHTVHKKDKLDVTSPRPTTSRPNISKVNSFLEGINALRPVINAMAGLIKKNINAKRNETFDKVQNTHNPPQALVRERPPAPSYPKNPLHNPTKSDILADSETAESQHIDGASYFQELMRHKLHPTVPTSETALLSGGIPISPGQVITANSDVIIGKPSVHGVRPPPNTNFKEVEGMVPPPPPPPPTPEQGWHNKDQEKHPTLVNNNMVPPYNPDFNPDFPEQSADNKITAPAGHVAQPTSHANSDHQLPPDFVKLPVYPTYPSKNDGHFQFYHPKDSVPNQFPPPFSPQRIKTGPSPYPRPTSYHPGPGPYPLKNFTNNFGPPPQHPSRIHVDDTTDLRPPSLPTIPTNYYHLNISHIPPGTVSAPPQNYNPADDQLLNLPSTLHIPILPPKRNDHYHQLEPTLHPGPTFHYPPMRNDFAEPPTENANPLPEPPSDNDIRPNSTSAQLLVNIQPSQVASVIIPPGGETTLLYNEHSQSIGPKGQIISEPSAYPDVKVGLHGSAGLSTAGINGHPVRPPLRIDNYHTGNSLNWREPLVIHNISNQQPYFPHISQLEYFQPPRIHPELTYVRDDDSFEDIEDDASDQIETEGGEVIQASNERPLRPGQLPPELLVKPSVSNYGSKIDPDHHPSRVTVLPDRRPPPTAETSPNVHYSVVFSKPVQLDSQISNKQPPIVSGKPIIKNPLSTSNPPKIKDEEPNYSADSFRPVSVPDVIPNPSTDSQVEETAVPPTVKPKDETIVTMNMDEKPPKPTFETKAPAFSRPPKEPMSSPRPFTANTFDRNSGAHEEPVVGLSPPPPPTKLPPKPERPTSKRPFGPIRKRPIPPYKFEKPEPLDTRPSKPTYPETEKPKPSPPVPTEVLKPPKPTSSIYFEKKRTRPTTERIKLASYFTTTTTTTTTSTTTPPSISPVLGGSLKVEELNQKPDDITADSKINNVITGKPVSQFNQPDSFTVFNGKPVPDLAPTRVSKPPPESPSNVITGSETIFFDFESAQSTQTLDTAPTTGLYSRGVTTIFQETRPNKPTRSITRGSPATKSYTTSKSYATISGREPVRPSRPPPRETKIVVTHTKTLTVTTTQSTVIRSHGARPSTHTLVITKTLTSMILDTVTEVHTLIRPTSILSTVTTTMPPTTTTHTVYPSPVPTSPPPSSSPVPPPSPPEEPDSILVVMTDKNTHNKIPQGIEGVLEPEIEGIDEEAEVAKNVLLASVGGHDTDEECRPRCRASRNELCRRVDGVARCLCRPGFARIFPAAPCKPTYTYQMSLALETRGKADGLAEAAGAAMGRLAMQSDLRDLFHGAAVSKLDSRRGNATKAQFYLQLSDNTEESKIQEIVRKSLKASNYSLGGTDVFVSKESAQFLTVEDFDECSDQQFHDCSENAQCFNLKGTYTCSCKDGFVDVSHNTLFPGRICSAEMIGCERCNFHGSCFSRDEVEFCECFQWYAGDFCQINLKVVLLVMLLVGASLVVLGIVCGVISCMRPRSRGVVAVAVQRPTAFRPATLAPDRRAIVDSASDASDRHSPPPYVKHAAQMAARTKAASRKGSRAPPPPMAAVTGDKDRSLTVMIPRAKYRPAPPLVSMSTFGPEQKLLAYLHSDKQASGANSRKPSNSTNHSQDSIMKPKRPPSPVRKPSTGALVSAGYEVSATVGRTQELDECFIPTVHTDLSRPAFSTIRTAESSIVLGIQAPPTFEAELLDSTNRTDMMTAVSQSRSYDETLIQPPVKSYYTSGYPKHTAALSTDENHTMVERDVGSSYTMTQSHLYKSERGIGSDISNFDSL